jgi:hypothetical protein
MPSVRCGLELCTVRNDGQQCTCGVHAGSSWLSPCPCALVKSNISMCFHAQPVLFITLCCVLFVTLCCVLCRLSGTCAALQTQPTS